MLIKKYSTAARAPRTVFSYQFTTVPVHVTVKNDLCKFFLEKALPLPWTSTTSGSDGIVGYLAAYASNPYTSFF